MRHFTWLLVTAGVALAGCGSSDAPPAGTDAGTPADSGTRDAAAPRDAATPTDGGGSTDAGGPTDAGGSTDAGPPTDAGTGRDAGPPVDAGPPGDAGPTDAGPPGGPCAFVTMLEIGCTTDADCRYGIHQTDCCGNSHAIGINVGETSRFGMLEPGCAASYPACGCPAGPTRTDSDETVFDPDTIQVGCISRGPRNVCLTYVTMRPPDGA